MKCHVSIQLSTKVCHILKKTLPFSFSSFSFPLFSFPFIFILLLTNSFFFFSPALYPPPSHSILQNIYPCNWLYLDDGGMAALCCFYQHRRVILQQSRVYDYVIINKEIIVDKEACLNLRARPCFIWNLFHPLMYFFFNYQ